MDIAKFLGIGVCFFSRLYNLERVFVGTAKIFYVFTQGFVIASDNICIDKFLCMTDMGRSVDIGYSAREVKLALHGAIVACLGSALNDGLASGQIKIRQEKGNEIEKYV